LNGSAPNAAVESNLTFNGSLLNVIGSISASAGITGSLFGTSSWATNAVTASFLLGSVTSASFATTAATASSFSGSLQVVGLAEFGEGLIVSGGLDVNGGITGSLLGTASFADTASYASNGTKTLAVFTPLDNNPPATDFATLDTVNSIAVLDFDAATDESAVFVKFIPENASLASGIRTDLRWMATSATGGNAIWGVQFEKVSGSALTDSFDTATLATGSTAANSGSVNITTITATTIDGLVAGDLFKLRVFRSGSAAADTMTGDAELVAVEVRAV